MNESRSTKSSSFFSPTAFRDLVSGRRRGAMAAALRGILAVAEVPYSWAVRWRNNRYQSGARTVYRVDVPVVSVGNLTLGGTGKTPMVEWIVRRLRGQGKSVGIISRGYGAQSGPNDEARELAWKLPGVPHVQNPDRVAAARQAIHEFGCQVLVLDDAFQHRRIARDLDIVLLDALEPLGYEHVFPRGTLREPVEGLARADVVALSRADLLTAEQRGTICDRVAMLSPKAVWVEVVHAPLALVTAEQGMGKADKAPTLREGDTPAIQQPLEMLRGRRLLAFCGLGNPAGFRHTLDVCGYDVVGFHEFPDHHAYVPGDLNALAASARQTEAEAMICTQKDLVKIGVDRLADRPLWAVRIGIDFLAGREEFENKLRIS
ncbi:MAG: tetraacyldisaccharide 4'-kinase [Thermoguttaceae bacterium]|jgi:tetraacyldisaccharide 4'-kinase